MRASSSRFLWVLLGPTLLAVLPNCSSKSCDDSLHYSINVTVRDEATGERICNASIVARDGQFQETLQCSTGTDCTCFGVGERLGTYEVTVSASGYQIAKKTVVVDDSDECHVARQHVEFKLAP